MSGIMRRTEWAKTCACPVLGRRGPVTLEIFGFGDDSDPLDGPRCTPCGAAFTFVRQAAYPGLWPEERTPPEDDVTDTPKGNTMSFTAADYADVVELASRETGGNKAAAVRQAVRQALGRGARPPSDAEERYAHLCHCQYRALRRIFSQADLVVIANAVRAWHPHPHDIGNLWAEVQDYLDGEPEAILLPPVDVGTLARTVQALSLAEVHALLYAIEEARRLAAARGPVGWDEVLHGPLRRPT